jgi:hypothetical protein
MLVWKQSSPSAITTATVAAQIGLVVGAVGIANHLIEAFVPSRPFVFVISPVLITLALCTSPSHLSASRENPFVRSGKLPVRKDA